ncbi:hypothetical protein HC928_04765 [bacterium]|nr:hypothetical protein [bacterium]
MLLRLNLSAAAQLGRCTASGTDPDPTKPRFIALSDPPQTSDDWPQLCLAQPSVASLGQSPRPRRWGAIPYTGVNRPVAQSNTASHRTDESHGPTAPPPTAGEFCRWAASSPSGDGTARLSLRTQDSTIQYSTEFEKSF